MSFTRYDFAKVGCAAAQLQRPQLTKQAWGYIACHSHLESAAQPSFERATELCTGVCTFPVLASQSCAQLATSVMVNLGTQSIAHNMPLLSCCCGGSLYLNVLTGHKAMPSVLSRIAGHGRALISQLAFRHSCEHQCSAGPCKLLCH